MRLESAALSRERVERRLTAILAADVAGYSRLIGADEEGTLARLRAHRSELIGPKIAEHKGRIVKTTGDGLLVEFASVVDALRCATEIQAGVAKSNVALPLKPGHQRLSEASAEFASSRPRRRSAFIRARRLRRIWCERGIVGFANVKTDYRARATTVGLSSRET
jgi:class 3 adenylate cyclase